MYKDIFVKFKNKLELVLYTTDILNLLVTDADVDYICLAETGEVIYTCENGMMINRWKESFMADREVITICLI